MRIKIIVIWTVIQIQRYNKLYQDCSKYDDLLRISYSRPPKKQRPLKSLKQTTLRIKNEKKILQPKYSFRNRHVAVIKWFNKKIIYIQWKKESLWAQQNGINYNNSGYLGKQCAYVYLQAQFLRQFVKTVLVGYWLRKLFAKILSCLVKYAMKLYHESHVYRL